MGGRFRITRTSESRSSSLPTPPTYLCRARLHRIDASHFSTRVCLIARWSTALANITMPSQETQLTNIMMCCYKSCATYSTSPRHFSLLSFLLLNHELLLHPSPIFLIYLHLLNDRSSVIIISFRGSRSSDTSACRIRTQRFGTRRSSTQAAHCAFAE